MLESVYNTVYLPLKAKRLRSTGAERKLAVHGVFSTTYTNFKGMLIYYRNSGMSASFDLPSANQTCTLCVPFRTKGNQSMKAISLKPEFVEVSRSHADISCAALLLALIEDLHTQSGLPWIYRTQQQFCDELFGIYSLTKIRATLKLLEKENLIESRPSEDKWDRTKQYRLTTGGAQ